LYGAVDGIIDLYVSDSEEEHAPVEEELEGMEEDL
jgi:hypothetical protein